MKIERINEGLSRFLEETTVPEEYTIEDAKKVVVDYSIDDIIESYDLIDVAEDLARGIDCQIYGERGLTGNCLVKKVKQMPYIDEEKAGLDFGKEEDREKVDEAIRFFVEQIEQKYGDDFVIVGRSGGYWGLSNAEGHIEISEQGYDNLAKMLLDRYNKVDRESYPTLSDVMFVDDRDFGIKLAEDSDNFEFEKDYIEKMQSLIKDIEDEEKQMNSKEYWDSFHLD